MNSEDTRPVLASSRFRQFLKYALPPLLVIGAVVFVAILAGLNQARQPDVRAPDTQATLVEAIQAESDVRHFTVNSQGTVRPRTETTLVSEVAGKVVRVSPKFIAGGFFDAGEVLLQIDPSDYEAAVKRAEATLASMHARLSDERVRSEQALRDWRNLGREGEPSDLVLRKPQLADAEANVTAAEADLEKARRDLQRTRISLPYDGLVREKRVDLGQYVSPGAPLGVTYAVDVAEVRLPLSAGELAYVDLPTGTAADEDAAGTPVTLTSDEPGNRGRWTAQIVRTEGVVDEQSRVVYAVAQVPDPYGVQGVSEQPELRFGTFVRAAIEGRPAGDVVVLPRSVLRADDTVIIADEDHRLEIREVTVLRTEPQTVWLGDGIEDGEWIVTTTIDAPIPGTQLAIAGVDDDVPGEAPDSEAVAEARP